MNLAAVLLDIPQTERDWVYFVCHRSPSLEDAFRSIQATGLRLRLPDAQESRPPSCLGQENATSIIDLPVEILTLIVRAIGTDIANGSKSSQDLCRLRQTCQLWYKVVGDEVFNKYLDQPFQGIAFYPSPTRFELPDASMQFQELTVNANNLHISDINPFQQQRFCSYIGLWQQLKAVEVYDDRQGYLTPCWSSVVQKLTRLENLRVTI